MALGHVNTINNRVIAITEVLIDILFEVVLTAEFVLSLVNCTCLRKSIIKRVFIIAKKINGINEYM